MTAWLCVMYDYIADRLIGYNYCNTNEKRRVISQSINRSINERRPCPGWRWLRGSWRRPGGRRGCERLGRRVAPRGRRARSGRHTALTPDGHWRRRTREAPSSSATRLLCLPTSGSALSQTDNIGRSLY